MAREQERRRVAGVFAWRRTTHSHSAPSALALRSAFGLAPGQPRLARRGAMRRDQVALLVDRVLLHEGLPQRYGTQFTLVDGRLVLHPVEEEAGLDDRRRSMDLPTMEGYMRVVEEVYGAPVARQS